MIPLEESAYGPSDFVQSLARGLAVIRAFDADHSVLSLSDVARRAGIPRAAARRFLRTLDTLGYVRAQEKMFSLTPRVLELGYSYLASQSFSALVQPHLERVSRRLGESVSAAVLDGTDVVYVARAAAQRIMSVNITVGTRFPAYATSLGRALIAYLPSGALDAILEQYPPRQLTAKTVTDPTSIEQVLSRVRESGWALVDEELEVGLRSIAVPIRAQTGEVVAAINCSLPSSEPIKRLEEECGPLLLRAAKEIEAELRLLPG